MTPHHAQPVANGLRTDHPIPELPFVDDSHIPVEDPHAIEAVGRHEGSDMWGREDSCPSGEGWTAFTTDSVRHELAWVVRWHPAHGQSVVLYRDEDVAGVHMSYWGPALLFRAGGYWWDGTIWYRPLQIWDPAGEQYMRRSVPAALTVTAADMLRDGGDSLQGTVQPIGEFTPGSPLSGRWLDDLALWASRRDPNSALTGSVTGLVAPELTPSQMLGLAQMAETAGVAASTLRAYISRGEAEVPQPQAVIGSRSLWARPVAEEWAEKRRTSPDSIEEALADARDDQPPGVADIWDRFTHLFFSTLWDNPRQRKRWTLRWRTEDAVRDTARGLGWSVAADVKEGGIIPVGDLAVTVRCAVLEEFAVGQELDRDADSDGAALYGITHQVARTLDWLIRHNPVLGAAAITEIIGEAERRLNIPRNVSASSIRTALSLDGKLETAVRADFLDRVLPPAVTGRE